MKPNTFILHNLSDMDFLRMTDGRCDTALEVELWRRLDRIVGYVSEPTPRQREEIEELKAELADGEYDYQRLEEQLRALQEDNRALNRTIRALSRKA